MRVNERDWEEYEEYLKLQNAMLRSKKSLRLRREAHGLGYLKLHNSMSLRSKVSHCPECRQLHDALRLRGYGPEFLNRCITMTSRVRTCHSE